MPDRGRFQEATTHLDFTNRRHRLAGSGVFSDPSNLPGWTFTRASVGYAPDVNGLWRLFASGEPRITSRGLFVESARTNTALWSRDMTDVSWVKVNMTAALTATGIDGAANSASTLTATAGNGTILQTLVIASTAETYSVWLRRVSGSGDIEIANDGLTFSAVAVTSTWTQFSVTATLANPIIGIRIVTSGDVIEADFNQLEAAAGASSPILTTSASAARAADAPAAALVYTGPLTLYTEVELHQMLTASNQNFAQVDDGTNNNVVGLRKGSASSIASIASTIATVAATATTGSVAAGQTYKLAGRSALADVGFAQNGAAGSPNAQTGPPTATLLHLGTNAAGTGAQAQSFIRAVAVFPYGLSDAQLAALTA